MRPRRLSLGLLVLSVTVSPELASAEVGVQVGARGGVELRAEVTPFAGAEVRISPSSSPLVLQPAFDYAFDAKRTLFHLGANALYEVPLRSLLAPYFGVGLSVSSFELYSRSTTGDDQGNRVGTLLLAGVRAKLPWFSPFAQVTQRIGELHELSLSGGVAVTLHERGAPEESPKPLRLALTPFIANNVVGDVQSGRVGVGVYATFFPWEWVGFELDGELHGHFFRDDDFGGATPPDVDLNTKAALFSGSVVVRRCWDSVALGAWCPQATAGAGAVHAWFDGFAKTPGASSYETTQLDPTLTAGLGLTHSFTTHVGLRVDARYFHAFVGAPTSDVGYVKDYDFLRLSAGVSIGLR